MISIAVAIMVAIGALAAAPASADDSLTRAREHFDKAQSLYASGQFDEAAEEFKLAHEARPFPQFLFNIGAAYEKAKKYEQAVSYYRQYLEADPKAGDKADVQKRIGVLEKEAARIAELAPDDPDDPDAEPDPDQVTPSAEVEALGDVAIRGLVVIESTPQDAYVYLDSRKKGTFARTPWSGSLEGEHTLFIEKRGYKPVEKRIAPDPNRLLVLDFTLAEEDYLGWVEIKSNVPGAEVYIDDRSVGAFTKTPYAGNLTPGKHTIWITAEGYDTFEKEIEVIAGETHEVVATLSGSPVGYLNFRGRGIEMSAIYVDGELLCERGPCRKPIKQGAHTIEVKRKGHRTWTRRVDIQPRTETIVRTRLAKKPGRSDAIWAYAFSAIFAGGGIALGVMSNNVEDDIRRDIELGMPPPDGKDSRFTKGKIFAIAADASFAVAGISLLTAIYYTFRDKGAPSAGTLDVRAIAVQPQLTPTYAGAGLEVSW